MRFLVERTRDGFESVGAGSMQCLDSGALMFYNQSSILDPKELVLLLAPGQWVSVVPEEVD